MEPTYLKIRITTEQQEVVDQLLHQYGVSYAYLREGIEPDLYTKVNFCIYLKTMAIRDFIRRKIGNGMPKCTSVPIGYISCMMKTSQESLNNFFKSYNIDQSVLEKAAHDDTLQQLIYILDRETVNLRVIEDAIVNYFHASCKPFDVEMMRSLWLYLRDCEEVKKYIFK